MGSTCKAYPEAIPCPICIQYNVLEEFIHTLHGHCANTNLPGTLHKLGHQPVQHFEPNFAHPRFFVQDPWMGEPCVTCGRCYPHKHFPPAALYHAAKEEFRSGSGSD